MKNPILEEAWQVLRAQIVTHIARIFMETGALETVIELDVREVNPGTGRMVAHLSDGALLSSEFDIWAAATAQGFNLSAVNCFGTAASPN